MSEQEFVNVPDRYARLGWATWRESLREVWEARGLCWLLTRQEVIARYRQSLIGVGWAIITPLATVAVFVFLKESELVATGPTSAPYPLFLYAGLLPWQFFHGCLTRGTHALTSNASLVNRVRFPRAVLVVSAVGSAGFDMLVGSIVLVGLMVYYGTPPAWTLALLPLAWTGVLLLGLALGLMLSVLNAAARDLGKVVPLAAGLGLFLTPVFYPAVTTGAGAWLNWINPMSAYVVTCRDLLLRGQVSLPLPLLSAVAVSLVFLAFGWRLFHVAVPRVSEIV